jgi:energy-coupling factor transport system substrate-specific component
MSKSESGFFTKLGFRSYTTRDILLIAVLAAIGGVAKIFTAQGFVLMAAFGPYGSAIWSGLFFIWPIIAAFVVRKPGAATISMVLGGVIELLAGSPIGVIVLYSNLVEGLGADIGFLLWRYLKYGVVQHMVAGMLEPIGGFVITYFFFSFPSLGIGAFIVYVLVSLLGGVLGGLLAYAINLGLNASGVIRKEAKVVVRE